MFNQTNTNGTSPQGTLVNSQNSNSISSYTNHLSGSLPGKSSSIGDLSRRERRKADRTREKLLYKQALVKQSNKKGLGASIYNWMKSWFDDEKPKKK